MNHSHDRAPVSKFILLLIPALILCCGVRAFAQTTGKISGKVTDARTGDPLPGVNVIVQGTELGASSDVDGNYFILNLPPGTYRLTARMVGYESVVMEGVVVSVNRTTTADFKLSEGAVQAKEVVVTVPRIQEKKDQTASIRDVSASQIAALPVENMDQVVSLQPGVVQGHFMGGRLDEVAYLVDGVNVNDAFSLNRVVSIENDAIADLEVITGTFNAEYGNAMSGVVNAVTKSGSNTFHGSFSANPSNFYTGHSGTFTGLKNSDVLRSSDYRAYLEGPILPDLVTFVVNGRYQNSIGPLEGMRRFEPNNYSDWSSQDSTQWYSEHTGDGSLVPMQTDKTATLFAKVSFKPSATMRTSFDYSYNNGQAKTFNFYMLFNPDGQPTFYNTSHLLTATINHTLSNSLFYELKGTYLYSWNANYLYANPLDPRYVSDQYGLASSVGPGFATGGENKNWSSNWNKDFNLKLDVTWQMNTNHTFKSGFTVTQHEINQFNTVIQNYWSIINNPNANSLLPGTGPGTGSPAQFLYRPDTVLGRTVYNNIYYVRPYEGAAYVQDKMEFDNMVINAGVRFDYFNPNTTYPSDLRNPGNDLLFPDSLHQMSTYLNASSSYQFSPRLGLAYKLGDAALLRFSYGHFFQVPPLYALYTDNTHLVPAGNYQQPVMGNPLVKAQRTIEYDTGLWQQLTSEMSLDVSVFYRDIYDLLGTRAVTTYNQITYGIYSNVDYGNARGLTLKYDFYSGPFSAQVNYTLQYTRGDANDPLYTFTREGNKQDPVNVLIPMNWDQRHTLNFTMGYSNERCGASLTGRFDSGTPYTWQAVSTTVVAGVNLPPNNSTMPSQFSVDLSAYVDLLAVGPTHLRLTMLVYNLFDALNEVAVNPQTGRADQAIIQQTQIESYRSDFSTVYQWLEGDPSQFANPREAKIGLEVSF